MKKRRYLYHLYSQAGHLRYIGASTDPESRFCRHLNGNGEDQPDSPKARWIRRERAAGRTPTLKVIGPLGANWKAEERAAIWAATESGKRLTNIVHRSRAGTIRKMLANPPDDWSQYLNPAVWGEPGQPLAD